jgi:hypothetical protein
MVSRSHLLAGTALAAMFAASQSARADLISWTVSGDFDDGGTFSGTFTYDNVADTATVWSLTTSTGTAGVGPNTYSTGGGTYVTGSSEIDFDNIIGVIPPYYTYFVDLAFTNLTPGTPGTVASLSGSEYDQECIELSPLCGPESPSRAIIDGTATGTDISTPEPASGALLLAGVGLLGVYRRRRRRGM